MNGLHLTIRLALLASGLLVGGRLMAGDAERQVATEINKANGLLRSGDADGAVKAYQQVQSQAGEREDLSYNMAVAQYRKGNVAAAEQLFKQTSSAGSDALAARSRYNLGNCNFADALRKAEGDLPAAIKSLAEAIDNYRSALDVDPNDADSRANIELASAMVERLREQEKKQQEQQKQNEQQQNKQQKNQQQNQQDQQQNQQSNSQPKNDQKDQRDQKQDNKQQGSQQNQQNQQNKDQQKSQNAQQQKSGPSQDKQDKKSQAQNSKDEKGSQDKQQKPEDATKDNESSDKSGSKPEDQKSQEQKSQEKKPKSEGSKDQQQQQGKFNEQQAKNRSAPEQSEKDPPDQSKSQRQSMKSSTQKQRMDKGHEQDVAQPAEHKEQQGKEAPKGALKAADEKTAKDQKGQIGKADVEQEGAMTTQEAEKMLQAIRDQEMLRRLRRQAAERNQHIPVDRDW